MCLSNWGLDLACHVCHEVILEDIFLADTIFSLVVGYRTKPIIYVNGEKVPDELAVKARSNQTLLSFLRDVMKLRGSKLGCSEGGCGACSVM